MTDPQCLLLSAACRADLLVMLDALAAGNAVDLPPCRADHPVRAALIGFTADLSIRAAQARARLADHDGNRLIVRALGFHFGAGLTPGRIALLFSGEGSQRIGMLGQTRAVLPPVGAWLDALDAAHDAVGQPLPSRLIHPNADDDRTNIAAQLFDIGHGGQITTAANIALFEILSTLGIAADAILGHSNGEHSATIATCMTTDDRAAICAWLRDVSAAGRAVPAPQPPQAMFAIGGATSDVVNAAVQAAGAFVAMDNCPNQQVVAGAEDRVGAAIAKLASAGAVCARLPFSRAYHTPLFADWAAVLADHYARLPLARPRTRMWSCLTASPTESDPAAIRAAMTGQWTAPVRLRETIEALYHDGVRTFVEVGCDDKLAAFVQDTLRGRPHLATAMLSAKQGELPQFRRMLAQLHTRGVWIDPAKLHALLGVPALAAGAPPALTAVIDRQRQLIATARANLARIDTMLGGRTIAARALHPAGALLGSGQSRSAGPNRLVRRFTSAGDPLLRDHALGRHGNALPVLSFTTSVAIAAEAARASTGGTGVAILDQVTAEHWLALYDGALDLSVTCAPGADGTAVTLSDDDGPGFKARVSFAPAWPEGLPGPELRGGRAPALWTAQRFYRDYAFHGPAFKGLRRITSVAAGGITAEAIVTDLPGLRRDGLEGDPALLDLAGQLVALWLLEWQGLPPRFGIFPYAADRIVLHHMPAAGEPVRCQASVRYTPDIGTVADVAFASGTRLVATIEGFRQRLISLPDALADRIFGYGTVRFSVPGPGGVHAIDLDLWRPALARGGGIWARALAHLILPPEERSRWSAGQEVDTLLATILRAEIANDDDGVSCRIWQEGPNLLGRIGARVTA